MSARCFFCLFFIFCNATFANSSDTNSAKQNSLLQEIAKLKDKSLQLSPDLKIAKYFKEQKGAETYSRLTTFLPQANLNLKRQKDFFEERNAPLRTLGLGPQNAAWTIDYQWTLFNYGLLETSRKTFSEKEQAELTVSNKEKEYPIAFNTNLLNYLLAKYKTAAIENSLKKTETSKKEAQLGFILGQKTKLDLLRTEANMVALESKKITYADEERSAQSTLVEYSGLENTDLLFLDNLDEMTILTLINSLSVAEKKSSAPIFDQSPLMQMIAYEEKINRLTLAGLTQSQWPDLKIQGSYNNSGDSLSQSLHAPYRTHQIALVLTIPLFGGGNFVSSHFEDYFAKKQIQYTIAQKRLETQNKLTNSLTKINALETLVSSLTLNVSQYEELFRLTNKSYQLGKSTLLELLEVQDNLLNSKISLAQNKIQFYTLSQNYVWQAGLQ